MKLIVLITFLILLVSVNANNLKSSYTNGQQKAVKDLQNNINKPQRLDKQIKAQKPRSREINFA